MAFVNGSLIHTCSLSLRRNAPNVPLCLGRCQPINYPTIYLADRNGTAALTPDTRTRAHGALSARWASRCLGDAASALDINVTPQVQQPVAGLISIHICHSPSPMLQIWPWPQHEKQPMPQRRFQPLLLAIKTVHFNFDGIICYELFADTYRQIKKTIDDPQSRC
jgi:hypothetical protein